MKITLLGTRGEIEARAPYHTYHSGMLIDDVLLFDLGEPSFLAHNPKYIFITHLHPDHAFFVRHAELLPSVHAPIYAPETYEGAGNVSVELFNDVFMWQGYTITAIPTEHSLKVKSQAYLIEKDGVRVLYTGDLFWIEKRYHHLFGKLDLVIADGSHIKEGGMIRRLKTCTDHEGEEILDGAKSTTNCSLSEPFGHTGIPNLIKLFAPYTQQILFVHFGTWFHKIGAKTARVLIKEYGREHGIQAMTGYDGMCFTVDKKGIR